MFEYNYLVQVPKGFMPKVNQMLYNNVAMKKTHELIYGDINYVLINQCDLDAVARQFHKECLPFNYRKTAIQRKHLQD